jgi:hypothetical protein
MENQANRNLSVKEAAELLGKSQQFVRVGLQRGILPFGFAIKMSSIWTYHISEYQLKKYLGPN